MKYTNFLQSWSTLGDPARNLTDRIWDYYKLANAGLPNGHTKTNPPPVICTLLGCTPPAFERARQRMVKEGRLLFVKNGKNWGWTAVDYHLNSEQQEALAVLFPQAAGGDKAVGLPTCYLKPAAFNGLIAMYINGKLFPNVDETWKSLNIWFSMADKALPNVPKELRAQTIWGRIVQAASADAGDKGTLNYNNPAASISAYIKSGKATAQTYAPTAADMVRMAADPEYIEVNDLLDLMLAGKPVTAPSCPLSAQQTAQPDPTESDGTELDLENY